MSLKGVEKTMKSCATCKTEKPLSLFYGDSRSKDKRAFECKRCSDKRSTEWRKQNLEKYRTNQRRNRLMRNFGITIPEYDSILEKQDGVCAICGAKQSGGHGRFHVDHDHSAESVRGILCFSCNIGLGYFKDNPVFLLAAIKYLGSTEPKEVQGVL